MSPVLLHYLRLHLVLNGIVQVVEEVQADEVITCAYTYTASASVISHVGAKIVLVDCSDTDGSIEMDYDKLEAAITEHTKAIIPVDIAGVPCDYDRIMNILLPWMFNFSATSPLLPGLRQGCRKEDIRIPFQWMGSGSWDGCPPSQFLRPRNCREVYRQQAESSLIDRCKHGILTFKVNYKFN